MCWCFLRHFSCLGLARGSALAGDTAIAREAFQVFFALWKKISAWRAFDSWQGGAGATDHDAASTIMMEVVPWPNVDATGC